MYRIGQDIGRAISWLSCESCASLLVVVLLFGGLAVGLRSLMLYARPPLRHLWDSGEVKYIDFRVAVHAIDEGYLVATR